MFGWLKKDPEIERVVARLSAQLEKTEDWEPHDGKVKHRLYNIVVNRRAITSPDHAWIPFRWRRTIERQIRAIYREAEVTKLNFMYDVIDGKYPYYVAYADKETRDWLKENATEDQYMIIENGLHGNGLYFIDAELAMGYKLMFEN